MSNSFGRGSVFETDCKICGRQFDNLGTHVFRAHGLLAREYRSEFNLPIYHVLVSATLSQKQSELQSPHLAREREGRDSAELLTTLFRKENARRRAQPTCKHGHLFDASNTRMDGTRRSCRKCDVRRQREYKERMRRKAEMSA